MSHRLLQVNDNLLRELSPLVLQELTVDKGLVTLTRALVTPDLRQATVWVSVLDRPKPEEIINLLNSRSSEFYPLLSKRLKMKYVPQLTFKLDDQVEELNRIDELLDTIRH